MSRNALNLLILFVVVLVVALLLSGVFDGGLSISW